MRAAQRILPSAGQNEQDFNLVVWTSDWHLVSDESDTGIVGDTKPSQAVAFVDHLKSLRPYGVIDTGDCKDHYGDDQGDEFDNYITYVKNEVPWLALNPGFNATHPMIPGNHDEHDDYNEVGSLTDFAEFDDKFWSAPYHWTTDWPSARIRFIAFHTYIAHEGRAGTFDGFFEIDEAEIDWLEAELDALPSTWKAITCSHAPVNPSFGNQVHDSLGGSALRSLLAANNAKIVYHFNGHRHAPWDTLSVSGIRHINGPGVSYVLGNAAGGWIRVTFDPATFDVRVEMYRGPTSAFGVVADSWIIVNRGSF